MLAKGVKRISLTEARRLFSVSEGSGNLFK